MPDDVWFAPNSTDELLANSLRDGDCVLINKRCTSLPLPQALLCMASKYGLSGDGRHSWDHAAMVFRDRTSNVPYLLEGSATGVTLRTFEERLLQDTDHQEVMLLPLRGMEDRVTPKGHREELGRFVHQELRLAPTADGYDGSSAPCCQNTWAVYRELRAAVRAQGSTTRRPAASAPSPRPPSCSFGAPLVVEALQRLGALDPLVDPAAVTPVALSKLLLDAPAFFGRPVAVRTL